MGGTFWYIALILISVYVIMKVVNDINIIIINDNNYSYTNLAVGVLVKIYARITQILIHSPTCNLYYY